MPEPAADQAAPSRTALMSPANPVPAIEPPRSPRSATRLEKLRAWVTAEHRGSEQA